MPRGLRGLDHFLTRQPAWLVTILCVALLGVVGYIDYATGPQIVMGPFYLLPIGVAAWYASRATSIIVALLAGAMNELGHDMLATSLPDARVMLWNALMRLSFFIIVAFLVRVARLYVRLGAFPEGT